MRIVLMKIATLVVIASCTKGDGSDGGTGEDLLFAPMADLTRQDISSYGLCNARCDTYRRCGVFDIEKNALCREACTMDRSKLDADDISNDARCPSAREERAQMWLCWQRPCAEVDGCLAKARGVCASDGGR